MKSAVEITNVTTPVTAASTAIGGLTGFLNENYLAIMVGITVLQFFVNWFYKHLDLKHKKLKK